MESSRSRHKLMLDILILDYNRPNETYLCLQSVKKHVKFPNVVTLLSNGGDQSYLGKFYGEGLIDRLILNKRNEGLGFGTTDLFKIARNKYSLYLQNDQFFFRDFGQDEFEEIVSNITNREKDNTKSVSIAGDPCHGIYSERAHIIETKFYNDIPHKPNGGAGPYHDKPWNEGYVQEYYRLSKYKHLIWPNLLVADNGKWAVRENPDGSIWRHRTDTKELELLRGPIKERYVYPNFTEQEWTETLAAQQWTAGRIPETEKPHSFVAFQ